MILRGRLLAAALGVAVLVCSRFAAAHGTGVSRATYEVDGRTVASTLFFRGDELHAAFGNDRVDRAVASRVRVLADGVACAPSEPRLSGEPPDGLRIDLTFTCARAPSVLEVRCDFLEQLPAGHTHLVTASAGDKKAEGVAVLAQPNVSLTMGRTHRAFLRVASVGVTHILTGYDHLAFLLALMLVPPPARTREARRRWLLGLVGILSAFTVGHTLSLAIATLFGVAPSPRIIEPAIALSIVYVACENFFVQNSKHRWLITFPFGLIHGFGFAGGLLDLAVDRADLPRALLAFNVGVEVGQLGVVLLFLPLLVVAERAWWFAFARRYASGFLAMLGALWFAWRLMSP